MMRKLEVYNLDIHLRKFRHWFEYEKTWTFDLTVRKLRRWWSEKNISGRQWWRNRHLCIRLTLVYDFTESVLSVHHLCLLYVLFLHDFNIFRPLLLEKPDIVVSTPSRLLAHIRAENITLKQSLDMLVVDEADLVFSFGYEADVKELLR